MSMESTIPSRERERGQRDDFRRVVGKKEQSKTVKGGVRKTDRNSGRRTGSQPRERENGTETG